MATVIFTAYDPANSEADLHAHNGQEVTILGKLSEDEVDAEVGTMYRIRFADGFETDAFDEELTVLV